MRIFVGYGYNDRDKWIEERVFPLLEALDCQPVHAKNVFGDSLSPKVKETLLACDAMIGFTTRREPMGDERWSTHRWVIEELASAFRLMPVVEIREKGVDTQAGMLGGNQRIEFSEDAKDKCLVELALAINQIRKDATWKTLKLGPGEFVQAIRNVQGKPGFRCKYRTRRRNQESVYAEVQPKRIAGGLYVIVPGLRDDDLIEVVVEASGQVWRSDYEPIDAVTITLQEE
jgi:hypothetical protein